MRSDPIDIYDVAIVGAGPTGLILASLLANYGVRVLLLERNASTVDEARAVTIDDESLRTLQATGQLPEVLRHVVQGYGVHYYSWRNRLFARIEPTAVEHGYAKRNAFRQQVLVRQLREGLASRPQVDLRFLHELVTFTQDAQAVTLIVRHGDQTETLRSRYLVACDGGRSGVREQLGIRLEGSSYDEKWLIVDMLERTTPFRHTRTYCDPRRPAIRLPGPDGTVRYEFMLHPGEDEQAVLDETQMRRWIAEREPADAQLPIARKVVYAFHARAATAWREGRVFLAGDAAHLTPPFAGQGMNSGVRDAANLAWKLAAVLQGAAPSLLDSYEQERKPHAWSLIRMALRIGAFMQPKSVLSAALAQAALKLASIVPAARDYVLQLRFKPKPRFAQGFFAAEPGADLPVTTGQLLPQPWIELAGGTRVRLDDVLGQGFAQLAWAGAQGAASHPEPALGLRRIALLRHDEDFIAAASNADSIEQLVRDCDNVLGPLLDAANAHGVLLRPDRYVLAWLRAGNDSAAPLLAQLTTAQALQPTH